MAARIPRQGGRVRFSRLGGLNHTEQSRWGRAPEPKGYWALPYGHLESFLFYHQWTDRLPKRLRLDDDRNPCDITILVNDAGEHPAKDDPRSRDELWDAGFSFPEGWHEERETWVKKIGRKAHPLRHFWYEGPLYAHFSFAGEILGLDQWTKMDASHYADLVAKTGGNLVWWRGSDGTLHRYRSSNDHLEVFIPRTRGRDRR